MTLFRALLIGSALGWLLSPTASAQVLQGLNQDGLPSIRYPQIFRDYYRGEYSSAGRDFRSQANTAYRDAKGIYLDSACYWVMQGECYRELGDLGSAVELYEQSLKLYGELIDWDSRTQFPPQINPDPSAWQTARISWGTPRRQAQIAAIPSLQTFFGNTDEQNRIIAQQGGVLEQAVFRTVDMDEVMRCLGVAAYRRWQLKGALCQQDPFTNQINATAAQKFTRTASLSAVWNGVLLGIGQASAGKLEDAKGTLELSLQFNRTMDHSLTPLALLVLADIAWLEGNHSAAREMYLEASFAAGVQYQYDLIGEALAGATRCDLRARKADILSVLDPALQWANQENAEALAARLLLEAAKAQVEANQFDATSDLLTAMNRLARGNDLSKTRLGTEYFYLTALVAFRQGETTAALTALNNGVKSWAKLAPRAYQINLTDQLLKERTMTPRQGDLVYTELLRDPTAEDWLSDPLESLSFMMVDHSESMKLWFDTLVQERKYEPALELVERIQRHRYAASQPLGGRLVSLRWLLETPESLLTEAAVAQRQDLATRYPDYANLANLARGLVEQLRGLPAAPEADTPDAQAQQKLATQLAEISRQQEELLSWIALRREPVEPTFRRAVPLTGSDSVVPPRTALVLMQDTTQGMHIFSVLDGVVTLEATLNRKQLAKELTELLKVLGAESEKNAVDLAEFPPTKWRPAVDEFAKKIFPKRDLAFWAAQEEIVIVPDGVLWYAPWDLLLNPTDAPPVARIRCCPLIALAIPNAVEPPRFPRALLAVGKFPDPKLAPVIDQQLAAAKAASPSLVERRSVDKSPAGVLGAAIDQLLVWAPLVRLEAKSLMDLSLAQIEGDKAPGDFASWLQLPFAGPRVVVIPFWTTGAAGTRLGDGEELFLASCNLLAMGAQTALVSRWYTGVTASCQSSASFAQRVGEQGGIAAWHASIAALRETPLDLGEGSRMKKPKAPVADAKSDHPFFWAGYLLIDTGWRPVAAEEDAGAEVDPNNPEGDPGKDGDRR